MKPASTDSEESDDELDIELKRLVCYRLNFRLLTVAYAIQQIKFGRKFKSTKILPNFLLHWPMQQSRQKIMHQAIVKVQTIQLYINYIQSKLSEWTLK